MTQQTISQDELDLLKLLEEKETELRYNKIRAIYPESGPYSRFNYPKHCQFMKAGKDFQERAFVAANRTGKTLTGAYEMACHLTGDYPAWWEGRKFRNPIDSWAVGVSNQSTKEIQQFELLGDMSDIGSGMVPRDRIVRTTKKPGVADAIETVFVKHVSGGISKCTFKSYEQGRESFQGTKKQVVWLDEEPKDPSIYTECLTRLMDKYNPGIIYCTFTPLFGLSDVVMSFLPDGAFPQDGVSYKNPYKFVINVDWAEVPHLDEEQKKKILSAYSPHEREARSKGIPSLGSGAIYPYAESSIVVDAFPIPSWWPKGFGMDVGWNRTAAIWGAMDPDSRTIYLYSEHYEGQAAPAVHASAIKARGTWLTGAIDPHARDSSQADGVALLALYEREGLDLIPADNSREAGILRVGQLLESGQLKVFATLRNWLSEYRVYRRDEKGKVVKKNDHLMDATRFFATTGIEYLQVQPDPDFRGSDDTFVNRDKVTGY